MRVAVVMMPGNQIQRPYALPAQTDEDGRQRGYRTDQIIDRSPSDDPEMVDGGDDEAYALAQKLAQKVRISSPSGRRGRNVPISCVR